MQGWFELLEAFVRAHPIWVGFGVAALALQAALVAVSAAWAPRWDERTISLNEGAMTEVPSWHESRLAYIEDTDYRLAQEDWPRLMKRLTLYAYLVEEVGDPDQVPDTDAMSDDEVDQELLARGAECKDSRSGAVSSRSARASGRLGNGRRRLSGCGGGSGTNVAPSDRVLRDPAHEAPEAGRSFARANSSRVGPHLAWQPLSCQACAKAAPASTQPAPVE